MAATLYTADSSGEATAGAGRCSGGGTVRRGVDDAQRGCRSDVPERWGGSEGEGEGDEDDAHIAIVHVLQLYV